MDSKKNLLFLSPSVQSKKERECVIEDFESLSNKALGEGSFGQVFKVRHKQSGNLYAIKMISKQKILLRNMLEQLQRELRIMYSLNHPYIIKLYNHFEDSRNFYLIVELAEGGSLYSRLTKIRSFDEKTAAQYLREVALAVQYLHTREPAIIHRDIKPENIFIDSKGQAKLGDFGWSSFNDDVRSTYCGTLDYLAPEMIDRKGHDTRLDLWNLGVLLFELLTGRAPFESRTQEELFVKIKGLKVGFPKNFPALAKDLVKALLRTKPEERIIIAQLLEHPWMTHNPPLRRTVEMQVKVEKISEDFNIPQNEYKVISQAEGTSKQLMQEKTLGIMIRKKMQGIENEIKEMQNRLEKLQTRQTIHEATRSLLINSIHLMNMQLTHGEVQDSYDVSQEDLDDKIVKISHKLRKIEFEIKLKKKEAAAKRQLFYGRQIKAAVSENTFLGLKSFSKEFKWLINMSKTPYYTHEFNRIIDLINQNSPDSLVHSYIEDLRLDYDSKPEISNTLDDIEDLITEKFLKIKELEEHLTELKCISKLSSDILKVILPNSFF